VFESAREIKPEVVAGRNEVLLVIHDAPQDLLLLALGDDIVEHAQNICVLAEDGLIRRIGE
jgi:hypothetical protein